MDADTIVAYSTSEGKHYTYKQQLELQVVGDKLKLESYWLIVVIRVY